MINEHETDVDKQITGLANFALLSAETTKRQEDLIQLLSKAVIALSNRVKELENQVQNLKSTIPF